MVLTKIKFSEVVEELLVGVIDAELIGKKKHRFPNLASMKISSYYKGRGDNVELVEEYSNLEKYDKIFISKVFTDTEVPEDILALPNVCCGGTGFYYDEAPELPDEIEHSMPDYHLYDSWVSDKLSSGQKRKDYEYYLDYSIGFLTRGCFRQCPFCVNKNYSKSSKHSQVTEFYDESRPKLCFLDDNFFACGEWKQIIEDVKRINKPFQFKQGLDERLLNDAKIHEMVSWKYDGDLIFAFDNIEDREIIEANLKRIFQLYPVWKKHLKFYILCGYDQRGKWDENFYIKDILDTFQRIKILSKYSAIPYIMRYERCYYSDYKGIYSTLAGWCNQPHIFKKFSYELYCQCKGMSGAYAKYKRDFEKYLADGGRKGAAWRYMEELKALIPGIAEEYLKFIPCEIAEYGGDSV